MLKFPEFNLLIRRVILVPIVVTSVLAGLLLWETFDLNRALKWVDHTDLVIDQSGHLLMLLVDMESGTRGFIVTGDESFLQPYLEGTKRVDSEFQALVSDGGQQLPAAAVEIEEILYGLYGVECLCQQDYRY